MMKTSTAVCLLALLAVASAIPTMNLPTEEPARVVHKVEDTLHADFVAWKAKVDLLCSARAQTLPNRAARGGRAEAAAAAACNGR